MHSGRCDQRIALRPRVAEETTYLAYLVDRAGDRLVDAGRGLQHRRHELLPHTLVVRGVGDLVVPRHELVALRREKLELLLDAHGERRAPSEPMFHMPQLA